MSTQDNANLLQKLKSGFKRTINWNKYQSETETHDDRDPYLDCLIDPSFQGINRLLILSFENDADRREYTGYYLRKVEIKDYNVKTDNINLFDQPINNDIKTREHIIKIFTGQGDDCATGFLLTYTVKLTYIVN